jgi:Ser/Thr protein kinase RdoA (MazF antagonist)
MANTSSALFAISAPPPCLDASVVAAAVEAQFGLMGEYESLVSERDQNFLLRETGGGRFVVKVTSAMEKSTVTDFQIGALLHLEHDQELAVPRVVRTPGGASSGSIDGKNFGHRLRVVTWVEGLQLQSQGIDIHVASRFGRALARLDRALQGYSHPGESPVLLWDLQRTAELREILDCIDDAEIRQPVARAIDDFESRVSTIASNLRSQVIHGDANPENVLISDDSTGFIDFGDVVKAPLVFDLAIAAAYLRNLDNDPTRFIKPFVAGYHTELPLEPAEIGALYDLIRARLATTITVLYWRLRERSEGDAYRQKTLQLEGSASQFLAALDGLGRSGFASKINPL